MSEDLRYCDHGRDPETGFGDEGWWVYDFRGVELCKVCERCEKVKLAEYRSEVLTEYYEADEDIEPAL